MAWTSEDERELRRLQQKKRRNTDTPTRQAMFNWANGDNGKAARKRYMDNGGREKVRARRRSGMPFYEKHMERRHKTYAAASRRGDRWTDGDDKKLVDLYTGGMTSIEIAPILGRSLVGVEKRLAKIGVKKSNRKQADQ